MELEDDSSKKYVFYGNDNIVITKKDIKNSLSSISTQYFAQKTGKSVFSRYKNLNLQEINKNEPNIRISDIKNLVDQINIKSLYNKISGIKTQIKYFEKNHFGNYIIGNALKINELYFKLRNNLNPSDQKDFSDIIDQLLCNFNQIIIFFNSFKTLLIVFFRIINNITVLLNKICTEQPKLAIQSYLIDQNQNLIFVCKNDINKKSTNKDKVKELYSIFPHTINQIELTKISENEESNDINHYIQMQISIFISKIKKILIATFTKNTALLDILDKESPSNFFDNIFQFQMKLQENVTNQIERPLDFCIDLIVPITSYDNTFNKNSIDFPHKENSQLIFLYFLANEILDIHSKEQSYKLFDEKQSDKIIDESRIYFYYNTETETYIPSFCLSYTFNQKIKDNDEKIDLNAFVKKIQNIASRSCDKKYDNELKEATTMNDIIHILNDLIQKSPNEKVKELFEKNSKSILFTFKNKDPQFRYFIKSPIYRSTYVLDDFLFNLLQISKLHSYQDSSTIIHAAKLIFQKYNKYISHSAMTNAFSSFKSTFSKNNNNDTLENIFNEIQSPENFFYFDIFFQIIIKSILDQNIIKDIPIDFCDDENDLIQIKELSINKESGIVYFDRKKYHFVHKLTFTKPEIYTKELDIYSREISKFIVHSSIQNKNMLSYIIPYFPFETLDKSLGVDFTKGTIIENKIEFTLVDKIVIIIEIATALKDLHSVNSYHGNLSCQCIFVNSKKDGYLGNFIYDVSGEGNETKHDDIYFGRPPEYFNHTKEFSLEENKLIDIYSFGYMIYRIIVEYDYQLIMKNMPKNERDKIIKKSFFEFLFSNCNNEAFREDAIDLRGDCILGIKDIIEKCMKINPGDRIQSFEELIDLIKLLPIYEKNKVEIEYRIEHAVKSSDYECTLSDIVESYYRGQMESKITIIYFIKNCFASTIEDTDNVIESLFSSFNITSNEDFSIIFEDIFAFIIKNHYKTEINSKKCLNFNNSLFSSSINSNISGKIMINTTINSIQSINFIIPVCSLADFISNNPDKYESQSIVWLYFIAKELLAVHTCDIYHGELETKNIGLYYDKETNSLIPSTILFYSFNKITQQQAPIKSQPMRELQYLSNDEIIEKFQKKDIKQFNKIASSLKGVPQTVLQTIQNSISMNTIVFHLYNSILKGSNKENAIIVERNKEFTYYLPFQITYDSMKDIFNYFLKKEYSFNGLILKISSIFHEIISFLNNFLHNINLPIIDLIPEINTEESKEEEEGIKDQIEQIKRSCFEAINKIYYELDSKEKTETINKLQKKKVVNYPKHFTLEKYERSKTRTWFDSPVTRVIELHDMYFISHEFEIRRYIFNLCPNFKYILKFKIKNSDKKNVTKYQDVLLKAKHISEIVEKIGISSNDVRNQDDNVIVTIKSQIERIPQ